jgi:hypothetical protein
LFILPYVRFSATAGQIAEKVEKGRLSRYVKMLEIAIMCIAGIGWVTHSPVAGAPAGPENQPQFCG